MVDVIVLGAGPAGTAAALRAADPVASRHWQIVWLLAQGRTGQHVAASGAAGFRDTKDG